MPDSPTGNHWVDGIFTASALVLLVYGWVKRVRPAWQRAKRDFASARDAVVGREAIIDPADQSVVRPALPGIGVRMSHQEQQMELLAVTVTKLVDQQTHQQALDRRMGDLEAWRASVEAENIPHRVTALEEAKAERLMNKVENTAMFHAIETVAKATPDVEAEAED